MDRLHADVWHLTQGTFNHLPSLVGEMVLEPISTVDAEGVSTVAGLWTP